MFVKRSLSQNRADYNPEVTSVKLEGFNNDCPIDIQKTNLFTVKFNVMVYMANHASAVRWLFDKIGRRENVTVNDILVKFGRTPQARFNDIYEELALDEAYDYTDQELFARVFDEVAKICFGLEYGMFNDISDPPYKEPEAKASKSPLPTTTATEFPW